MGVDTVSNPMVGIIQSIETGAIARNLALNPSEGNVGIGTTSPAQLLDVNGTARATNFLTNNSFTSISYPGGTLYGLHVVNSNVNYGSGAGLSLQVATAVDGAGGGASYVWYGDGSTGLLNFAATKTPGSYGPQMSLTTDGRLGLGTTAPSHILHINGQGRATNSAWATTSDMRLKDLLGPFEGYGLNEIKQIETIRFRYKKDNPLNLPWREDHIGVSAQQLQTLIPDAVVLQSDGYLTVNTDPVFWTIVNSVKELAQENEDLKAASERKDTDIAQLKAEAAALKAEAAAQKTESAGLKKFICTQFPSADICSGP